MTRSRTAQPARPAAKSKSASATQLAGTQKPGKREKIRFGQAPRESLPARDSNASTVAAASPVAGNGAPPAGAASPADSTSAIGVEAPAATAAEAEPRKTRFSDRARVHKTKKQKAAAEADDYQPSAASADELANKKVQDAPLGLADQAKKKKEKEPKTRLSDKKTTAKPVQQPYMQQTLPARTDEPQSPAPAAAPEAPGANGQPAADQPAANQPDAGAPAASPQ